MKSLSVTIQMKAIEQFFPTVLFILLYKVVLTFGSVDEILQCRHWVIFQYFTRRILELFSVLNLVTRLRVAGLKVRNS